jgi:hypothetical protein
LGPIFFAILVSVSALATPIKPELKELLREAQRPQFQYMPARAGWNGPEVKPRSATLNPTYEKLKYAQSPEAVRKQVLSVILPDARALSALLFLIFTLRFIVMRQLAPGISRGRVITMPSRRDSTEQAA